MYMYAALQSKKAVSACLLSTKILPFGSALQDMTDKVREKDQMCKYEETLVPTGDKVASL